MIQTIGDMIIDMDYLFSIDIGKCLNNVLSNSHNSYLSNLTFANGVFETYTPVPMYQQQLIENIKRLKKSISLYAIYDTVKVLKIFVRNWRLLILV
jgi:hypothetical protein